MKKFIFIFAFIVLAGGAGYYIWSDFTSTSDVDVEEPKSDFDSSEPKSDFGSGDSSNDQNTPKIVLPVPNLDREISKDADTNTVNKIKEISEALKDNPDLYSYWLDLGIYRKTIDDYEGTKEAWEYASKIRPNSSLPLNNLGDLYAFYIKDNIKAEQYFLKAIDIDPSSIYSYYRTYEFYLDVINDKEKAKQILEEGIRQNPDTSGDLQKLLNNLN